jgi:glycerol-3-phosphate acyltransferase PlsY
MHTPSLNTFLLWCLGAYLAGSIPFGLILVKLAGKGDVRAQGSGNIGATNVLRTGGKALGILTLALDVAKGFAPVFLAKRLGFPAEALSWVALASTAGHIYTPWLKFQGGKGVATALGAILGYHPAMALPCLAGFALCVGVFRYVSLGSIVAALILIPAALGFLGAWACLPFLMEEMARYGIVAWIVLPLLVVRRHAANIQRLLNGTEAKLWGGKKEPQDA